MTSEGSRSSQCQHRSTKVQKNETKVQKYKSTKYKSKMCDDKRGVTTTRGPSVSTNYSRLLSHDDGRVTEEQGVDQQWSGQRRDIRARERTSSCWVVDRPPQIIFILVFYLSTYNLYYKYKRHVAGQSATWREHHQRRMTQEKNDTREGTPLIQSRQWGQRKNYRDRDVKIKTEGVF